ncbi:leucyl/phenylalanyl-tRNA-protein transferase [Neisseria shayeganii 871]|uniref:Leucyl/phenylalanyl-tRNA-protein transferase n=1 Tax=Neisseria shayeganii 871 TaxID=1032488 RepID=G4CEU2_9NEIS|nr:leucyl/phenylalanyl-tRNA-protein transferase [Neisseria shayeganii 871]
MRFQVAFFHCFSSIVFRCAIPNFQASGNLASSLSFPLQTALQERQTH